MQVLLYYTNKKCIFIQKTCILMYKVHKTKSHTSATLYYIEHLYIIYCQVKMLDSFLLRNTITIMQCYHTKTHNI